MSEALATVTDSDFDSTIKTGKVLVDFWAEWCGPCRMQTPILEKVVTQVGSDVTIAKLNVDENPAIAGKYNVMSIPTLILFKDGEVAKQFVGVQNEGTLVSAIEEA